MSSNTNNQSSNATSSNAVSSNAVSNNAVSSNAVSNNVTPPSNNTPSNATPPSNNTSSNATSSNNTSSNNTSSNNTSSNVTPPSNNAPSNNTGNNNSNNNSNNNNNNNNNNTNNNTNNNNNLTKKNNNKKVNNIQNNASKLTTNTKTSNNTRSFVEKAQNKVKSVTEAASERVKELADVSSYSDNFMFILKVVLVVLVLLALFYVGRYYLLKYQDMVLNSPYLLEGIKNSKRALVISQDPENQSYIPIAKSKNQDGIQFTYDFWMLIETFDYKPGQWKHVFHKGSASGYPNRAPGAWLHPSTNAIRFYMNSQESILEYVDVDNLPARKWLHFSIVLDDKDMDVYVNGYLKSRKKLTSVPKQNNDDFWVNMYGGFEGYMAKIRYYSRAISPDEILSNVRLGPGNTSCIDGSEVPAYFDDNWWYNV